MAIAGIPHLEVYPYPPERPKRRYARRDVEAEMVGVELGDSAPARVLNLSEGGARVKSAGPLALANGTLVLLSLPGGAAIHANCEVVWSDAAGGAGLRFLAFSDNSKTRLERWLSDRPAAPAESHEPTPQAAAVAVEELPFKPMPAAEPDASAEADEAGLEDLVRRMLVMTAADGAAIALQRGEAIVCCATAGNAPRLGVRLDPDAGLSGQCLRSGEPVLCRDSESDARVNPEACRALRLRAALLVPVKQDEQASGVLEVFSSKPDVFDMGDVAALQRLSVIAARYASKPPTAVLPAPAAAEPETPPEPVTSAPAAPANAARVGATEEAGTEVLARPQLAWPNAVFRLVDDPQYRPWKRVVYWSAVAVRKTISLATLTVPLSYLLCFLVGPVIRPGALVSSKLFGYVAAVVEPGMALADDFFSFRGVIHGWNLMFLVMAAVALIGRAVVMKPINLVLRKAEDQTRPRKQYAYVPRLTEFR